MATSLIGKLVISRVAEAADKKNEQDCDSPLATSAGKTTGDVAVVLLKQYRYRLAELAVTSST